MKAINMNSTQNPQYMRKNEIWHDYSTSWMNVQSVHRFLFKKLDLSVYISTVEAMDLTCPVTIIDGIQYYSVSNLLDVLYYPIFCDMERVVTTYMRDLSINDWSLMSESQRSAIVDTKLDAITQ